MAGPEWEPLREGREVGGDGRVAPGVVHEHHVQLPAPPRAVEVRGVLRDRRAQGAPREHPDEDPEVARPRDQLLDADAGDLERREAGPAGGPALAGAGARTPPPV